MRGAARQVNRGRGPFVAFMIAPAAILYGLFVLYPMAQAFRLSLYRWSGLSQNKEWVGLGNFQALFTEQPPEFLTYLGHNAKFLGLTAVIMLPAALLFATALSSGKKSAQVLRAVYLFPNVISVVAVATLWYFLYDRDYGLVNAALQIVGLGKLQHTWLGDSSTAFYAIIATSIWASLGFYILLFNAGVQSIPVSLLEAADLDGATGFRKFRFVTLPLIWEVFQLGVLYLVIHSLNLFGLVYVMNLNQPNSDTDVILTYLYQKAFAENEFGYAAAIASVGFLIIFGAVLMSLRVMRRETIEL